MSLTIDEFRGLTQREKELQYSALCSHDKFIASCEYWVATGKSGISTEEFLKHPPKGWVFITKAYLMKLFPNEEI